MLMATPALTDLQRIELAFPAAAMLHVLDHAADAADPRVGRIRGLLVGTVDEVLRGLTQDQSRKLRSRIDRVLRTFLSPLARAKGRVDVVGLIVWRVLDTRSPVVGTTAAVGFRDDVRPAGLVSEGMEPEGRFSLSFRLQRGLELLNGLGRCC